MWAYEDFFKSDSFQNGYLSFFRVFNGVFYIISKILDYDIVANNMKSSLWMPCLIFELILCFIRPVIVNTIDENQ